MPSELSLSTPASSPIISTYNVSSHCDNSGSDVDELLPIPLSNTYLDTSTSC